ncbi:MAG TPA: hypothetical protein VFO49_19760 [Nocardioides sp.]|nr:hypothetical protein [Nocardioides sp.]
MSPRVTTAMLAVLTASAVYVGGWAELFPRSFYDSFPGVHRVWVSVDGPFNEHLVRDVGAFYLAFAVGGVLAMMWRDRRVTLLVAAMWTTFSVPHLGYHLHHLGALPTVDAVGQSVALGGTLVLSVVLLVDSARRTEES